MTLHRFLMAIFAVMGWVLAGFQAFLLYNALHRPFDDSISLAGRHTDELLALHERNDQSEEVLAWLKQYHGEAPGHQVRISFIVWAIDNTKSAETILEKLQTDAATTNGLAFAITDGCRNKAFRDAFGQSTSSTVRAIISEVDRLQALVPSSGCV
ncbi:hypothetical protein [Taklimakanibacter lacteus]|uniref:hypothetical protein n=1 Tax=Taklimakanibacter lacteus TaxID=2268456 RepID=UPI000E664257